MSCGSAIDATGASGPALIVVLNASVNALRPENGFIDYYASKAAVASIARTLSLDLGAAGIWVTRTPRPWLEGVITIDGGRACSGRPAPGEALL